MEVLSKINDYRKTNRFCDVVIKVDTECFEAHKAVLAASSDYFEQCLSNTCTSVKIPQVNAATFNSVLDFLYASNLDINSDNHERLREAAEVLNIPKLAELCMEYQTSTMNPMTVNMVQSHSAAIEANNFCQSSLQLEDSTEIRRSQQVSIFPISKRRERKDKSIYTSMNQSLDYLESDEEGTTGSESHADFDDEDQDMSSQSKKRKDSLESNESGAFECEICKATFSQILAYQLHQLCHDDKPIYKCDICGETESTNAKMKEHMDEFHSLNPAITGAEIVEAKSLFCHLCERKFSTAHNFSVHMKTHGLDVDPKVAKVPKEKPSITCTLCDKVFKNKSYLRRHMMIHTGERKHCCSICGKRFLKTDHLKRHERTHTDERPFPCEDCGKTFRDKDHLKKHRVSHSTERPYFCEICGKQFKEKSTLSSHQKCHLAKATACEICGKSFKSAERLRYHTMKHAEEKPHVCETCGRKFAYIGRLRKHILSHTGERPYHCETCGKQFRDNHSLRLHRKLHTGIGLYPCMECGKQFTNQFHYTRHERMHTGEKPFKCEHCHRSFSRVDNLDAHKRACAAKATFSKRRSGKTSTDEAAAGETPEADHESSEINSTEVSPSEMSASQQNGLGQLDHIVAPQDGQPPSLVNQPHYQARVMSEALKFAEEPLEGIVSSSQDTLAPADMDRNVKYLSSLFPQTFPDPPANTRANPQLLPVHPSHTLERRLDDRLSQSLQTGLPSASHNPQALNFDVNSAVNTFMGYGNNAL